MMPRTTGMMLRIMPPRHRWFIDIFQSFTIRSA